MKSADLRLGQVRQLLTPHFTRRLLLKAQLFEKLLRYPIHSLG